MGQPFGTECDNTFRKVGYKYDLWSWKAHQSRGQSQETERTSAFIWSSMPSSKTSDSCHLKTVTARTPTHTPLLPYSVSKDSSDMKAACSNDAWLMTKSWSGQCLQLTPIGVMTVTAKQVSWSASSTALRSFWPNCAEVANFHALQR